MGNMLRRREQALLLQEIYEMEKKGRRWRKQVTQTFCKGEKQERNEENR